MVVAMGSHEFTRSFISAYFQENQITKLTKLLKIPYFCQALYSQIQAKMNFLKKLGCARFEISVFHRTLVRTGPMYLRVQQLKLINFSTRNLYFYSSSHTLYTFKSFKFGNGSRISDQKLVILEFKYLQNKKWSKKAVKSTRIKKSYRK